MLDYAIAAAEHLLLGWDFLLMAVWFCLWLPNPILSAKDLWRINAPGVG
jgi:hypothetical protein